MYPEHIVKPMKEELTNHGFSELKNDDDLKVEEVADIIENFLQYDNTIGIGDITTCYDVDDATIIRACEKIGATYDPESGMIRRILKDDDL